MKPILSLQALAIITASAVLATTIEFEPSDGATAIQDSVYYSGADSILLSSGTYYLGDLGPSGLVVLDSLALVCIDGAGACTLSAVSGNMADTSATVINTYFDHPISMAAVLHGFVITGAKGESGGGIMAYNGCPAIDSCFIVSNSASSQGGGIMVVGTSATIRNSTIEHNSSLSGGGIFAYGSNVILENTEILYNTADSSGGGVFFGDGILTIKSCLFDENEAESGGGIFAYDAQITTERSSHILNNQANESGGGIFLAECEIDINNLELANNNSWDGGGGMLANVTGVIRNSILISNTGVNGGCFMLTSCTGYELAIERTIVVENEAWEGGAFFIDSCEVTVSECSFTGNSSIGYGGIFFLHRGRNLIKENRFYGNSSVGDGAGLFFYRDKSIISRNRFEMNDAHTYGGALYVYGNSEPIVRENLFNANKVFYGAAIYVEYQSIPHFIKNTVVNNIGNMGACISVCEASILRADSCFFADNGSIENRVSGLGSAVANAESVYITNSNIYYNTLYSEAYWANSCSLNNIMTGNFWWTTDTSEIRGFLDGPVLIEPIAEDFVVGAPGEPYFITSIRSLDRDFGTEIDMAEHIGDTIFLEVEGQDRNPHLYEAAVLRIRSSGAAGDIAIGLAETDSCSGIYRGEVYIAQATDSDTLWRDDVFNRIRVNPSGDTIIAYGNIDTSVTVEVAYMSSTMTEESDVIPHPDDFQLHIHPNPFNSALTIAIDCGGLINQTPTVEIFDVNGRMVDNITVGARPASTVSQTANGVNKTTGDAGVAPTIREYIWQPDETLASGVYLVRARFGTEMSSKKIIYLK